MEDERGAPNRQALAQPPVEFTGIQIGKPEEMAAGFTAVKTALNHVMAEMNPFRGIYILNKVNQHNGVDCPGCAWPDPAKPSKLGEYCENGAKAIAEEATTKKIGVDFFAKYSVRELSEKSDYWLGKQGRIVEPMILRENASHYTSIDWEQAFQLIGEELNRLPSPNDAIFYTSGRTSNEAAFLYQLFVRQFGTNNLPDCSNMCHESSGVALSKTVGIGKGSVKLEDFYKTDLIMIFGQNPGTNHPRMLSALKKAKANGAKIISVNPLREAGLLGFKDPQSPGDLMSGNTLSDQYLQVKINGDVALLKALMLCLWYDEKQQPGTVFDWDFIQENTDGYSDFITELQGLNYDALCKQAGIPPREVRKAADIIRDSETMIACWAMGITQHKNGVANIQEIVNLLLLKGSIAKPGAGTCPVRGHSNVQGDRTMGIWEKPPAAFLDRLESAFDFSAPRNDGYNTVEAIKAMHSESGKVFFAMGGNFLSAAPDTEYTANALRNCRLTVQVSTKLNRSHLVSGKAAIILPCLGRTDKDLQASGKQFVTVENSMGVVHSSHGQLNPPSEELLSEPQIVAKLAMATFGPDSKTNWQEFVSNYDLIRDKIEEVIPGFENYNKRVRETGGFYLPNGAREGNFKTATGKANFTVNSVPINELQEGELMMMTIRSHDQFNTTIYGLDDRYRGIKSERRVILMNETDIKDLGFKAGQKVDLFSNYSGVQRSVKQFIIVAYNIPKGSCATYFPEANPLVPIDSFADESHTPTSKLVRISLVG